MPIVNKLRRPCSRCGKMFEHNTPTNYLCESCREKSRGFKYKCKTKGLMVRKKVK